MSGPREEYLRRELDKLVGGVVVEVDLEGRIPGLRIDLPEEQGGGVLWLSLYQDAEGSGPGFPRVEPCLEALLLGPGRGLGDPEEEDRQL